MWYKAVEEYAKCSLTEPNDKLPAISALAQNFSFKVLSNFLRDGKSSAEKLVYIGGLWAFDLHHGLAWRNDYPGDRLTTFHSESKVSREYLVPSFRGRLSGMAITLIIMLLIGRMRENL
jgi:hypothetical protein